VFEDEGIISQGLRPYVPAVSGEALGLVG